jgi:hypothetical protein
MIQCFSISTNLGNRLPESIPLEAEGPNPVGICAKRRARPNRQEKHPENRS